jgi:hypothetical protein
MVPAGWKYNVKLYFTASGVQYSPQILFLRTATNNNDTLTILEDIHVYSIASIYGDTLRYVHPGLGDTVSISGSYFYANGNEPFVIKDFWSEGDSTIKVKRSGPDTLRPGKLDSQHVLRIDYVHIPIKPGRDTMTTFIRGENCDKVFHVVLIMETRVPAPKGAQWSHTYLSLSSTCFAASSATAKLINNASVDKIVDSVVILHDTLNRFNITSEPPDRFRDFTLSPGTEVSYMIGYTPLPSDESTHEVTLVAYNADGINDTVMVRGSTTVASLHGDQSSFEIGDLYVGSTWSQYEYLHGRNQFRVSEIRNEGPMDIAVNFIMVGTQVGPTLRIEYLVTSDSIGPQTNTLTFKGNECDTPLVVTFHANFLGWASVSDPDKEVEGQWNGRELVLSTSSLPISIEIYDLLGRLVGKHSSNVDPKFDLSYLNGGSYIIKSVATGKILSQKIVKY